MEDQKASVSLLRRTPLLIWGVARCAWVASRVGKVFANEKGLCLGTLRVGCVGKICQIRDARVVHRAVSR